MARTADLLDDDATRPWRDALAACALVALDPAGFGGVRLRGGPSPARDRWLALLRARLAPAAPVRRIPVHVDDERLLGGLDLAATLAQGTPIAARGLLAEADGGIALLAMAERQRRATLAHVAAALDTGTVTLAREGFTTTAPARVGIVAFDEGRDDDAMLAPALADRLAFDVELDHAAAAMPRDTTPEDEPIWTAAEIAAARARVDAVAVDEATVEALVATALALGIDSMRAPRFALRAARALAALDDRDAVDEHDAAQAARLVLAPRATVLPAPPPDDQAAEPPPPPPESNAPDDPPPEETATAEEPRELADVVLDAAVAAMPPGLLAALAVRDAASRSATAGRVGGARHSALRGRPMGHVPGLPRGGARLALVATLRAAAPWQRLRRPGAAGGPMARIEVRRDDLRIRRYRERTETTTIFVVDASGSAALHRLAEAKGAVELLLADCYIRRDRVALVVFRGRSAEVLLPPTRSLVRAKRALAELPGGGATPLAAGLDLALDLALNLRRQGSLPGVVLLTDGRANIARDGAGDRERARDDALAAARHFRADRIPAVVVDTSARPEPQAAKLAEALGGRYVALPYADAGALARAARGTPTARAA